VPTVLLIDGFRFFFYSKEHLPAYIYIEKAEKTAKFNLENFEVVKSSGFNSTQLKTMRNLVEANQQLVMLKRDEFFNN